MLTIDSRVTECFERAYTECLDNGVNKLETIFVFKELMKLEDGVFHDFLKNECNIDDVTIDKALEQCIEERVKISKNPKKQVEELLMDSDFDFFEEMDDEYTTVTDEFEEIIDLWQNNIDYFLDDFENKFGQQALQAGNVKIKPDFLLACILGMMPIDIVKFVWMMNLTLDMARVGISNECLFNGIEIEVIENPEEAARKLKNYWENLMKNPEALREEYDF